MKTDGELVRINYTVTQKNNKTVPVTTMILFRTLAIRILP